MPQKVLSRPLKKCDLKKLIVLSLSGVGVERINLINVVLDFPIAKCSKQLMNLYCFVFGLDLLLCTAVGGERFKVLLSKYLA